MKNPSTRRGCRQRPPVPEVPRICVPPRAARGGILQPEGEFSWFNTQFASATSALQGVRPQCQIGRIEGAHVMTLAEQGVD